MNDLTDVKPAELWHFDAGRSAWTLTAKYADECEACQASCRLQNAGFEYNETKVVRAGEMPPTAPPARPRVYVLEESEDNGETWRERGVGLTRKEARAWFVEMLIESNGDLSLRVIDDRDDSLDNAYIALAGRRA